jgi:hypothetical protein
MKKTGVDKVIKRIPNSIVYKINSLREPPYKEQVVIRDFTSKPYKYG